MSRHVPLRFMLHGAPAPRWAPQRHRARVRANGFRRRDDQLRAPWLYVRHFMVWRYFMVGFNPTIARNR